MLLLVYKIFKKVKTAFFIFEIPDARFYFYYFTNLFLNSKIIFLDLTGFFLGIHLDRGYSDSLKRSDGESVPSHLCTMYIFDGELDFVLVISKSWLG